MTTTLRIGDRNTISQLFSGDKKIIIPDLQRDYCWGDPKHGNDTKKVELVSGFVSTLWNGFENNKEEMMLGVIYGFENPINHIHLCDGQQRITTLFLLLGMLCRKNNCSEKNNHLMSEFEFKDDDHEPYLQYSIRESTLYFLSDLTYHFFIKKEDTDVEAIKKASWYFKPYDQDPSIQSMLEALSKIEKELKAKSNLKEFQNYIENKLYFLYLDLKDREKGEDLFVIINTTGEPLTATENLKPMLLGSLEDNKDLLNKQWEDREDFFWKNKKDNEYEADNGYRDFISWYVKIQQKQNEVQIFDYFKSKLKDKSTLEAELTKLHSYFEQYKSIIKLIDSDSAFKKVIEDIKKIYEINEKNIAAYTRDFTFSDNTLFEQQNILLPLLHFAVIISNNRNDLYQFLRRLRKNFFDNKFDYRKEQYVDWRYILQIIEIKKNLKEILTYQPSTSQPLKEISNIGDNSVNWYNEEEQFKDQLRVEHSKEIEEWEDNEDFMGDISPLLRMSVIKNDDTSLPDIPIYHPNNTIFERLKKFNQNYKTLNDCLVNPDNKANLSNYYRLFRVLSGSHQIGHFYYWSNRTEGVIFSNKNQNFNHLKNIEFLKLCASDNLLDYCKSFAINTIKSENLLKINEKDSVELLIKAWLSLKTLLAEKDNILLSSYNGTNDNIGISAYIEVKKNLICSDLPFCLSNLICGYLQKNDSDKPIIYANKNYWKEKECFDTPLCENITKELFEKARENKISLEEKESLKQIIEENEQFIYNYIKGIDIASINKYSEHKADCLIL